MNNDLIRRGELLDNMPKDDVLLSGKVRKVICEAPAVDAEEVVRCRDCKNWNYIDHLGCTEFVKLCKWGGYMVGANGYCVYGERREDDA